MEADTKPRVFWPRLKKTFWTAIIISLLVANIKLWSEANDLREQNKKLTVEVEASKKVADDRAKGEDALVQKIIKAMEKR